MKKLFWLSLVVITFSFTSCSTFQEDSVTYIDYPEGLNDARYYFKKEDFGRAESEVQRYLGSSADVYWHGHAYLLLGEIREATGKNADALEAYRKILGHSKGYHSASTAQALYRISWIFEHSKKYDDLLITLLDLERALGKGDNFVKHVETPARIANTYYVLNQWDRALKQREKVGDEVFEKYKDQAKSPAIEFQARLYRSFLGMEPTQVTPVKSQDILNLTQKELLAIAEVSTPAIAERALNGIQDEYERYFNLVKQLAPAKNQVEIAKRNQAKLEELAQFVDHIEELRASRRPPELVKNQDLNLAFFRKLQDYEDQSRALTKKIDIGVQKAKKSGNISEPFADAPEKKQPAPVKPKTPKKF